MYFKQKSNVMFRNFEEFGYITDNRNFGYTQKNSNKHIGDKILSESGAAFFSVLNRTPQSFDEISKEIYKKYSDVDMETIYNDLKEFLLILEKDGFVVSGETIEECEKKDIQSFYKKTESIDINHPESLLDIDSEQSTQDFFDDYFKDKKRLTNLQIEITGRCNERCVHCYIPHDKKLYEMERSMFYSILEQASSMKLLHLTLTGGEPMLHPDFCNFLRKCKEYDLSVNVLSNLTLINDEIIEIMKENPLLGVQVSLYSMDASVHDEITQIKGSFEKTRDSIYRLIENDIPLQISCPIMKQNKSSYLGVKSWGEKNNIRVGDDYVIIGRYDHVTENLENRLSINEVKEVIENIAENDRNFYERIETDMKSKIAFSSNDPVCSICHSSLCISEEGRVYPCAGWQDCNLGNLKQSTLEEVWNNSKQIEHLRSLKLKDFPKCISCPEKEFCTMCMVRNANEDSHGNPLVVNKYFCEIAKFYKEIYLQHNKNHKK